MERKYLIIILIAAVLFLAAWVIATRIMPADTESQIKSYCDIFYEQNNHCPYDKCEVLCDKKGCECLPIEKNAEINFTLPN